MATTAKNPQPADVAAAAAPKKRSRLRLALLALAALLLASGAGGWYVWQSRQAGAHGKQAAQQARRPKPAFYLPLKTFTVNLQHAQSEQYLQVGLTLKLTEESYEKAVKARMPDIRNRILLLLSSQRASEISTVPGKRQLSAAIGKQIVAALGSELPLGGLTGVLFTSFVIQ